MKALHRLMRYLLIVAAPSVLASNVKIESECHFPKTAEEAHLAIEQLTVEGEAGQAFVGRSALMNWFTVLMFKDAPKADTEVYYLAAVKDGLLQEYPECTADVLAAAKEMGFAELPSESVKFQFSAPKAVEVSSEASVTDETGNDGLASEEEKRKAREWLSYRRHDVAPSSIFSPGDPISDLDGLLGVVIKGVDEKLLYMARDELIKIQIWPYFARDSVFSLVMLLVIAVVPLLFILNALEVALGLIYSTLRLPLKSASETGSGGAKDFTKIDVAKSSDASAK